MKIFITVVVLLFVMLSLSMSIDSAALSLQDEAIERSFIAFGLAKGLNAIISLLQGTEFAFTPVGLGVTISVGEVLDPFNDLVERFSWIMLGATVSLGIQKLLLVLSGKLFLQVVLVLSGAFVLLALWYKKLEATQILVYALRIFTLLVLLRFAAIVFVYLSSLLYTNLLQKDFEQAQVVISSTQNDLQSLEKKQQEALSEKSGFFESMNAKYEALSAKLNVSKELDSLEKSIDEASRKIVTLITLFVLQSILLPLSFLWLMIIAIKATLRLEFNGDKYKLLYNAPNR